VEDQDCGCGKRTRRQFLQTAAVGAAAIALSGLEAEANNDLTCDELYDACVRNNCGRLTGIRFQACRVHCWTDWVACQAGNTFRRMQDAINDGMNYLRTHPGVAAGTFIFIGGFTLLIFATGGGALAVAIA